MSRKAQLGIVDLVSVLVAVIVIVVFMVMMGLPGCMGAEKTQSLTGNTAEVAGAEGKIDLLTYLRSPVKLEEEIISMAEAISANTDDSQLAVYEALSTLLLIHNSKSESKQFIIIKYPNREDRIGAVSGLTYGEPLSTVYVPYGGETEQKEDALIKVEMWASDEQIRAGMLFPGMKLFSEDEVYVYWGNGAGNEWNDYWGAWALDSWPCITKMGGSGVECANGYKPTLKEDAACFVSGNQFAKYDVRPPKGGCQKKELDIDGNVIVTEEYK